MYRANEDHEKNELRKQLDLNSQEMANAIRKN